MTGQDATAVGGVTSEYLTFWVGRATKEKQNHIDMQGIGTLMIPFLGLRKDFRRPTSFQQFLLIAQVKSYINCEDPRSETAATSLSK